MAPKKENLIKAILLQVIFNIWLYNFLHDFTVFTMCNFFIWKIDPNEYASNKYVNKIGKLFNCDFRIMELNWLKGIYLVYFLIDILIWRFN